MHVCTKFILKIEISHYSQCTSSIVFVLTIWFKNLDCMLLFLKLNWLESWLENLKK